MTRKRCQHRSMYKITLLTQNLFPCNTSAAVEKDENVFYCNFSLLQLVMDTDQPAPLGP